MQMDSLNSSVRQLEMERNQIIDQLHLEQEQRRDAQNKLNNLQTELANQGKVRSVSVKIACSYAVKGAPKATRRDSTEPLRFSRLAWKQNLTPIYNNTREPEFEGCSGQWTFIGSTLRRVVDVTSIVSIGLCVMFTNSRHWLSLAWQLQSLRHARQLNVHMFRWQQNVFVLHSVPATLNGDVITKAQFEALQHAMKQLETKYTSAMRDKADLTDSKEQLEHLIMQLQGETETIGIWLLLQIIIRNLKGTQLCTRKNRKKISVFLVHFKHSTSFPGEYITLYQQQRHILRQRQMEKDDYIYRLARDREELTVTFTWFHQVMVQKLIFRTGHFVWSQRHQFSVKRDLFQDKLGQLQALVMQLLGDRHMLHNYHDKQTLSNHISPPKQKSPKQDSSREGNRSFLLNNLGSFETREFLWVETKTVASRQADPVWGALLSFPLSNFLSHGCGKNTSSSLFSHRCHSDSHECGLCITE